MAILFVRIGPVIGVNGAVANAKHALHRAARGQVAKLGLHWLVLAVQSLSFTNIIRDVLPVVPMP
jgi:hypothetical protein